MYVVSVSYIICYITYDILFPKRGEGGEMEWARIFPNSKIDNRRKGREGDKKRGGLRTFPVKQVAQPSLVKIRVG